MPARNRTKQYVESGYYHIYNRGVEKRPIFMDKQDYAVFLSYLRDYLLPKDIKGLSEKLSNPTTSYKEKDKILKLLRLNNFFEEIILLAYCLMPNHFHFLIKQKSASSIDKFMQSLATRYTMYFNRKYNRVGFLYQDVYKAVLIQSNEQFLHLSRYIHKQALALQGWTLQETLQELEEQPSSYLDYLGKRQTDWIFPSEVLLFFSKTHPSLSYQSFIQQPEDFDILQDIILENGHN